MFVEQRQRGLIRINLKKFSVSNANVYHLSAVAQLTSLQTPVSPSQNKFLLFLEGHLSQSSGLLRHQGRASKRGSSLPVSLPRWSCSARCHCTYSPRLSLRRQLPCQPGMVLIYQGEWRQLNQSPPCSVYRCAHTGIS